MTLPTLPHAILAHLQGTQNQDTKPTLQKSCNSQHTVNTFRFYIFPDNRTKPINNSRLLLVTITTTQISQRILQPPENGF